MTEAELTEAELENILGPIGMNEYQGAYDSVKPKLRAWAATLATMSDANLVVQGAGYILDAAILSTSDVECRVTGIYREAGRRHVAAGHAEDCHGSTLYTKAHNRALVSQGHSPSPLTPCTCAKENSGG